MPFSAHALKKTIFLTLILWWKTNWNVVYRGLYSYRQRVHIITLFPNIFYYFCMLSEFEKVFERKVWCLQVDFFHYLWYCGKKTTRMWFSVVYTLINNDTSHHSGQNLLSNHFIFRHIDKVRDGYFQNLSSRYNHLARGDYSRIWRHSRPMRVRGFL